jgi:hypothetical protein
LPINIKVSDYRSKSSPQFCSSNSLGIDLRQGISMYSLGFCNLQREMVGDDCSKSCSRQSSYHTNKGRTPFQFFISYLMGWVVGMGASPTALAYDGTYMWVSNTAGLTRIDAYSGIVATVSLSFTPTALAFDGTYLWMTASNGVYRMIPPSGAAEGPFTAGTTPAALAFDGTAIWVANHGSNNLTKFRAADGSNLGTFSTPNSPSALAFDGARMWVANGTSLSRR